MIACAKHFVGDGGTHNGINEGNTICTYNELEEIHMKPYLDCLAQGVSTIMASYTSWNGSPLHSNYHLITEVLKGKLGFKVLLFIAVGLFFSFSYIIKSIELLFWSIPY